VTACCSSFVAIAIFVIFLVLAALGVGAVKKALD